MMHSPTFSEMSAEMIGQCLWGCGVLCKSLLIYIGDKKKTGYVPFNIFFNIYLNISLYSQPFIA